MPAVLALFLGRKRPRTVAACASAWWRTWLFLSKVTLVVVVRVEVEERSVTRLLIVVCRVMGNINTLRAKAIMAVITLHSMERRMSCPLSLVQLLERATNRSDCVSEESVSDAIRFSVAEVLARNQLGRLLVAEPRMALLTSRDTETSSC